MNLEYDYVTGNFENSSTFLRRSISQYTTWNKVKIGITNNPDGRWRQHSKSDEGWARMIVKYRTNSLQLIKEMERQLIEYQWEFIENQVGGGGGNLGATGPYYLYILLK